MNSGMLRPFPIANRPTTELISEVVNLSFMVLSHVFQIVWVHLSFTVKPRRIQKKIGETGITDMRTLYLIDNR